MAAPVSTKPGWRFGVFEVDAHRGELRRAGVPIKLRDQSFQILLALLENPGEIVTRDELRHLLWPSDTYVDFDHSLNTAMMKLRDALGDSTEAPIYIETVPKRGYRFVAPVALLGDENAAYQMNGAGTEPTRDMDQIPEAATNSAVQLPAEQPLRGWLIWIALSSTLVVLAGAGVFWGIQRYVSSKKSAGFRIVPVTTAPGVTLMPAISPDGRMIAYIWDGPERKRYEVYVKLLGAQKPHRITYEGGRIGYPTWSPDGEEIAFTRCDITTAEGNVIVVPALGGDERRITEAACPFNYPSPLVWSAMDGGRLVFVDRCSANGPLGLISFSLATGKRDCLTDAGSPGFEHWFAFSLSPDGRYIAFNPSIRGGCNIYTIPISGGTPKRIVQDRSSCETLMWTPDGTIVFSWARTMATSLWRLPASGGKIQKEPLYPGVGSFSKDGQRFVYQEVSRTEPACIWRADLAAPGGAVVQNRKLIATQNSEGEVQVSPNGAEIVWQSWRTGAAEIWIAHQNGDEQRQLTHMNSYTGSPRWSPDGKSIAFDYDRGSLQVFTIDIEGRNLHQLTSGNGANVVPSWSRNGRWIYFSSERTGRGELWKHSLDSGAELQVTSNGGMAAFESFDGKTVYFTKFNKGGIWSMPSEGGAERIVLEGKPQTLFWGSWTLTRAGIYYINIDAEPKAKIEFYDFATRRTRLIFTLEKLPEWAGTGLSATADGRMIYYVQHDFQSAAKMMEFGE